MTDLSFEYVIIGAGTAGLALAARLAENPIVSVCVLEAGKDHSVNEDIKIPGKHAMNIGKEWDEGILSVPQAKANDRVIYNPRGKGLGGTSILNFMQLVRSPASEYDAFETALGAKGWNAAEFLKYFKKSQHLSEQQPAGNPAHPLAPDPALYGAGPIPNTVPAHTPGIANHYYAACATAGVPFNPVGGTGDNSGVWPALVAVNPVRATRVSAETAYLAPMRGALNLTLLIEARAMRILFKEAAATGVQYVDTSAEASAETRTVHARKEVIVCAGAFHTPRLLELSGIGGKEYIPKGVPHVVDLPGVGNNLQDHPSTLFLCETDPRIESYDVLADPEQLARLMKEYKAHGTGLLSTAPFFFSYLPLRAFMPPAEIAEVRRVAREATLENTGISESALALLKAWMEDDEAYQVEIIMVPSHVPFLPGGAFVPGKKYCFFSVVATHPFARGSAHRSSAAAGLDVDLGVLAHEIDTRILTAGMEFVRRIVGEAAMAGDAGVRAVAPAPSADMTEYVRHAAFTAYHPVGSAAMLPRAEGGVVDPALKVYGVRGLRVVDASVIPVHLSCHPMATIYAIAEKAADMIKAEATEMGHA